MGMPAVRNTTLDFRRGGITVLIGPSGSGKSTMLRLMNGLILPTEGTVSIDGEQLTEATMLRLRQRMGYVIQEGGLFPHLNARENITLLASYVRRDPEDVKSRIEELCSLTHLESSLLERYPAELSGGQRQRVSLMRALMCDPEILLLDEPLGALDPMVRAALQTDLKRIFTSLQKTVILVTHDLAEAAYFADEIVLMNAGAIVQSGTYADLNAAPANTFVQEFIAAQTRTVLQ